MLEFVTAFYQNFFNFHFSMYFCQSIYSVNIIYNDHDLFGNAFEITNACI